jgi:hypothetical protein
VHAVSACKQVIADRTSGFKPPIGLVLDSGLSAFANYAERFVSIEFCKLPGFSTAGVVSYAGRLMLGGVCRCCSSSCVARKNALL